MALALASAAKISVKSSESAPASIELSTPEGGGHTCSISIGVDSNTGQPFLNSTCKFLSAGQGGPNPSSCQELYETGIRESGVYRFFEGTYTFGSAYCDLSGTIGGVAWTLLMRVATDTGYGWSASAWTTEGADGSHTDLEPAAASSNAKFNAYDHVKVHQLRFDNTADNVYTVAQPVAADDRGQKSLLELVQTVNQYELSVVVGQPNPIDLVYGGACGGFEATCPCTESACQCGHFCDGSSGRAANPWRINAGPDSRFRTRIGGTFSYTWGCGYSGGGASEAGFGTHDSWFGGFTHHHKGFGIRDAHDTDNLKCDGTGIGQMYKPALIWASEKAMGAPTASSCQELYDAGQRKSDVYQLVHGTYTFGSAYCDLSGTIGGVAWTLLMRVATDTGYGWSASAWTTEGADGSHTDLEPAAASSNAKFNAYDHVKVHQLRFDNTADNVYTVAQPVAADDRGQKSLLELVQTVNQYELSVVVGQPNPIDLVYGGACGGFEATCPCTESACQCGHFCDGSSGRAANPWRINAGPDSRFRTRIGGTFSYTWGCGYSGGGASEAGFGTHDSWFGGFTHHHKGFGIRDAHDTDNLKCDGTGIGQMYKPALIWASEKAMS